MAKLTPGAIADLLQAVEAAIKGNITDAAIDFFKALDDAGVDLPQLGLYFVAMQVHNEQHPFLGPTTTDEARAIQAEQIRRMLAVASPSVPRTRPENTP